MGYLLPIENYQAQSVQTRLLQYEQDYNRRPIERIYPIKSVQNINVKLHHQTLHQHRQLEKKLGLSAKSAKQRLGENTKLYAQITGIGEQIDCSI